MYSITVTLNPENNTESDIDVGIGQHIENLEEVDLTKGNTFLVDCSDGQLLTNGKSKHYKGDPDISNDSDADISPNIIAPGSVIEIQVDTINGNLKFIENGEDLGFAVEGSDALKTGTYYLTLMLFDEND